MNAMVTEKQREDDAWGEHSNATYAARVARNREKEVTEATYLKALQVAADKLAKATGVIE